VFIKKQMVPVTSMEPIEVTAHFDEHGSITPLHFTWKGSVYRVESTGRRWLDNNGQHILVMISSGRIYELTYKSAEGRWFIGQAGPERMVV
jgi:hypothetical protein